MGAPTNDGHLVQYYEKEGFLYDRVTDFMSGGLRGSDAAVLIATRAHRDGVESRLFRKGVDLAGLTARGRYHALDAHDTLSRIMVDGAPDPERFANTIGPVIKTARAGDRRVLAFGEMVALLWSEGNRDAAIRLEELWNDLARKETFALLCAYPIAHFDDAGHAKPFADINAAHTWVTPAESYSIAEIDERNRVIATLQQKAAALEAETKQRAVLEAALRGKIDELAEVDRRKDEFLAMLGHELRNPLAPVTTALQLMRIHEGEPNRVARSREIVERQIEHMTRLIDDLLDVSRITRGKIELREQPLLLSAVIERAIESARPLIDERGHRIALDLPTEPVTFLADPARLGQVFANLLNNAAKYTDVGGRIWLRARVEGNELMVGVKDDGPGLTNELRKHAFELFMQGPQTRARAHGGLGIGLTLVRRLVELHGGTVEALSEGPGKGTDCRYVSHLSRTGLRRRRRSPQRVRAAGSWWSTTTSTPPRRSASSSATTATRSRPRTTVPGRSTRLGCIARTSSCSTSACRRWTGTRSPSGSVASSAWATRSSSRSRASAKTATAASPARPASINTSPSPSTRRSSRSC